MFQPPATFTTRFLAVSAICLCLGACNRAAMRVPGASLDFPDTDAGSVATRSISGTIEIAIPVDMRAAHLREAVAGTSWTGCTTDAIWTGEAAAFVQQRLKHEIDSSKLFVPSQDKSGDHYVLNSEIDALCSQVKGFVIGRAAGIVSMHFSLLKNGKQVWEKKIEHVVTDADPEYTGSQVTTIEQAMRVTEADSLRLVFRDLVQDIERSQPDQTRS
jgi:hypothetical protein